MEKNTVKLNICGTEYTLTSEDSEEYICSIGNLIDNKINEILNDNSKISITMAAVLAALTYCDYAKKAEKSADNLRVQIKDYLEDSSKSRMEADESRREIERMQREIQMLRTRLAEKDATSCNHLKNNQNSSFKSCAPISKSNSSSQTYNSHAQKEVKDVDMLNFFKESSGDPR